MTKAKLSKRITSIFLSIILLMTCIPLSAAADTIGSVSSDAEPKTEIVVDPGTAYAWETMMGTAVDGNRYAGRVWVDKSVYKNGDTAVLNTKGESGSAFEVSLQNDETFQVIFSALGSTMTTTSTTTTTGPLDVVLVLDTSTSMDDTSNNVTRLERVIKASNKLLDDLLTVPNVRIAIVTYNKDSETVLPLATYNNGIDLVVTDYYNNGSSDAGVVTAYDDNGTKLGNDSGYTQGTNLQAGIDKGFNILANASDVEGRIPVAIVLTDGQANRANRTSFYSNIGEGSSASDERLFLGTLLNAAYNKTKIEAHYGVEQMVYTIGVDLKNNATALALMNPGSNTSSGFNSSNGTSDIRDAYRDFLKWADGSTVTYGNGNSLWTFDHNYNKLNGAITRAKIAANINYADTYYDVSNAEVESAFKQIYEELSSNAFNPIDSSSSVDGGTGVDDTPLIYVDYIGQHMEIKEIQAVTLFGASYGVVKKADGTYTVTGATGTNPTTNETWNTAEDIIISVTETAGIQKLEIKINQEILPIIMEQAVSQTVGGVTSATITEVLQSPLRVYYTVGLDSDILLPNGKVDVSKIQGYTNVDNNAGTVSFYSNQFGVMNPAGTDGKVVNGDAHVGFQPSAANRYYYHQLNQGIFTKITDKSGRTVTIPESNEYGIVWDEDQYNLTWMTYEEYEKTQDTDKVYTYVTFYRPTPSTADAANAAEEVTYLVYTNWGYLKESVAFYDSVAEKYLNDGAAVAQDQVASVISAYKQNNPNAEIYAVLGKGSLRTSRFHNMTFNKENNSTGTAVKRYVPEYTHDTASAHNGNDVVVWLGNNGKITVPIDTGIALTKQVTEAIGNASDTYSLTVTVPSGVTANPVVVDANGNTVESTYSNNVLTVNVKAGETVYVSGIPGGTEYAIGEIINGDYYKVDAQSTASVMVPTLSQVLATTNPVAQFVPAIVTNAPCKYGNLFITKAITSDHTVPSSIQAAEFGITVNVGTDLAGKTFTVLKTNSDNAADSTTTTATVDESGNLTFVIKASQTIEIQRLPEGTKATVTEALPDSYFAVSYRTRNHSGETADDNNVVEIPANGNATAVVLNRYTPSSVSVDLDIKGTKNFTAEGNHDGGKFVYKVQKWDGTAWKDISGKTAETSYEASEFGPKTFTIEDVLEGITYTEVGSYAYQVMEVKGDVANVTYDRTLYTFNVTVTDIDGQLEAKVTDLKNTEIKDGSYEVEFNNTYHTAPVSIDITKIVDNQSGDNTVSKAGFEFKAVQTDASWNALTGDTASELSVYSDASGEARFTATYEDEGTYYYKLTEVAKNAPGWTCSSAEYHITVEVSNEPVSGTVSGNDAVSGTVSGNDATSGSVSGNDAVSGTGAEEQTDLVAKLKIEKVNSNNADEVASVDGDKGRVSFENTYVPENISVNLDGMVKKELTGKTLTDNMFTFHVYNNGDRTTPVLTGTNKSNGTVHFVDFNDALTFERVGKYEYDVVEVIPDGAVLNTATGKYVHNGMSYDPTIYDLVVEVTNDITTGKLVANYYFEDAVSNVVTFNNSYKATPTQYTLGGSKVLIGRAPKEGEFSFGLYEGGTFIETVTNKADGSFSFKPITYTESGSHTYTIKEVDGTVAGVTYSGVNKPITVTVTVTDTNGVLSASPSVINADIEFENTYTPTPAQVTFNGIKELEGGTLVDNTFTFKLYKTDNSFDITKNTATLLATAKNVNGAFSFERTLDTTGTFFFVIVEDAADPIADVVYDSTQHRFMVTVSDIGDGQLKAIVTNMETGYSTSADASVSAEVTFTNATFDEVTEKEVYLAGGSTTEIDGQKVNAGDILTYFISYTNYTGKDVVVDIMDTIPEHTTYVEGSASGNGTYVGTHVNWILDVPKGQGVLVSFDVKVNETDAIVANEAVVRDGVNTYTTNEVVNHTVEEELVKDVFSSADTTVSIDGKKVYEGDELLYEISYTNITGDVADIKITDNIPANTTYVAGSADNGGVYGNGAIVWDIEDVPAWATVTVTFKVTVNSGIGAATIKNQATATDGTNNYVTEWVSNHTIKDEVEKKVFKADNNQTNIDCKQVYAGDELVYTITYKNTSGETAAVTITDTVPQNTTYVDGSADNGGTYSNGVITWTKDVAANAAITVSFKVKVNAGIGDATISNKATITEGKNTYTTNEVLNYTFEEKGDTNTDATDEPTTPTTPTPIPGVRTGDESNLWMWFALLFICAGGLVGTALYGKKRKATEK